jgi:hypothetical protein
MASLPRRRAEGLPASVNASTALVREIGYSMDVLMGMPFESTMADKTDKKYTSIKRDEAAGRVEFRGGKAVWEWADRENDSTSILLKSLENPELELEKTQNTPLPRKLDPKAAAEAEAKGKSKADEKPQAKKRSAPKDDDNPRGLPKNRGGGGFDPYNRS